MEPKIKVAVYVRLPKNEEDSLNSILEDYRKKFAMRNDCMLIDIFYDIGKSGLDKNREGYQNLLHAVMSDKIDYIVTKHPGKLSRDANEFHKLRTIFRERGIGLYFEESA